MNALRDASRDPRERILHEFGRVAPGVPRLLRRP
jgi:hypothetical protein